MIGYLLDTNVPSELRRLTPDPHVSAFLSAAGRERVHVSVMTLTEICHGIARLPQSKQRRELQEWLDDVLRPWFAERVLPITELIAERCGTLMGEHQTKGRKIPLADAMIAATALEHGLIMVTRNVKHFEGLGLTVMNPWETTA